MGQCSGKPVPPPQRIQRAPLPFVQVDPVHALLPHLNLVKHHSSGGAGGAVDRPTEPVAVKSHGALETAQPCMEPVNNSRGPRRRRLPPPKPLRSPNTKLSTTVALDQKAAASTPKDVPPQMSSTTHRASVDDLHHHSMDDEGYGTIERADRSARSATPTHRMDVVPSCDATTTNKDKDKVFSGSTPEPLAAHRTVRMATIQRKDVPDTTSVPAPAVSSMHSPATRREVIPTTGSRAFNHHRTLERSRSYQCLYTSSPATRKDVIPTTSHTENHQRTLQRSRSYQCLLMSSPATRKDVIPTTSRTVHHYRTLERSMSRKQQLLVSRSNRSSSLGGHRMTLVQTLATIPEYGTVYVYPIGRLVEKALMYGSNMSMAWRRRSVAK